MKELQVIMWILYICTSIVALCFAIFALGLLPLLKYIDELERIWAVEFSKIMVYVLI